MCERPKWIKLILADAFQKKMPHNNGKPEFNHNKSRVTPKKKVLWGGKANFTSPFSQALAQLVLLPFDLDSYALKQRVILLAPTDHRLFLTKFLLYHHLQL